MSMTAQLWLLAATIVIICGYLIAMRTGLICKWKGKHEWDRPNSVYIKHCRFCDQRTPVKRRNKEAR